MKRSVYCIIFLIIAALNLSAQKTTKKQECDFLGPLHFQDGKATVIIKATYNDFFRSDEDTTFENYFSRCCSGSAIAFTPENCPYEYSGTINKKVNPDHVKFGQTVYLTCAVFEGVKNYDDTPFFVIDKIESKETDTAEKEDIKPLTYIKSQYINTESGCGYFSNDADALSRDLKCVLVITPHYLAFVQTADNKFIYFSYEKRVTNEKGYVDTYKNDHSSFELNINKIIGKRGTSTYRNGRLTLTINNVKTSFNVYGIDEEFDKYNKPDY